MAAYDELPSVRSHLQNHLSYPLRLAPVWPRAFSIVSYKVCYVRDIFEWFIVGGYDETALCCSVEAEGVCCYAPMIMTRHYRAPSRELWAFVLIEVVLLLHFVIRER